MSKIDNQELKEITRNIHRCKAVLYSYLYQGHPLTHQESETVAMLKLGLSGLRAKKRELENAS